MFRHTLFTYLIALGASPLFVSRFKSGLRPMGRTTFYQRFITLARGAGLSISPHNARHTIVTKLINEGLSPVQVQKAMGHATLATTMVYFDRANEMEDGALISISYENPAAKKIRAVS